MNFSGGGLINGREQTTILPKHSLYRTIPGPTKITAIKFSQGGKYLAVAYEDGFIGLFNPQNGVLFRSLEGHTLSVCDIAFSHEKESLSLASISLDVTLKLWDLTKAKLVRTFREPLPRIYTCCCFDFRSDIILAGECTGSVTLFDVVTGCVKHNFFFDELQGLNCMVPSTDHHILTSSLSGHCITWATMTGVVKIPQIYRTSCPVISCAFSSDGLYYLESLLNNQIHVRQSSDGNNIKLFMGHQSACIGVNATFSHAGDTNLVVSGSEDGQVFIWDFQTTNLIQKLQGHNGPVLKVECHPCDTIIASASTDKTVRLWTSLI